MIFSLKHISQIIREERELQKSFQKNEYILACYKIVNLDLIEYFKNNYLLHKAYLIEDDGPITPLSFNDVAHLQNKISIDRVGFAESIASKKGTIPFTKIILNQHIQALVLYKGKKPDKIDQIITQDLEAENSHVHLAKKLGVRPNQIKLLLDEYHLHSKYIGGQFYAYFIRPFAEHKFYNGVFLLLLKRPLKESEFLEIGNLWTKILSETAVVSAEKSARAMEQELIFEEQTHTWNTEITSIAVHLDVAQKRFRSNQANSSTREIQTNIEYAFLKIEQLRIINAFNLFLMKTRGMEARTEIVRLTSHISDENIFAELQIGPVAVKDTLQKAIYTLMSLVRSLNYIDKKAIQLKIKALKRLQERITQLADYQINTIQTGFGIIVLDLLKNALFHSDLLNPEIDVKIERNGTYLMLQFINNSPLPKVAYEYINHNKNSDNIALRRKAGIRTIKRIIASRLFNSSSARWELKAAESSLTGNTNIMLLIPKTDLK